MFSAVWSCIFASLAINNIKAQTEPIPFEFNEPDIPDWVPFNTDPFDSHKFLTDNIVLLWTIGVDGDDNKTRFGVASQSEGYLALGFSDTGSMKGAHIAMGRQGDSGFEFQAMLAEGFVQPQEIEDSDIVFVEGAQEGGATGFIFDKTNRVDCVSILSDVRLDGQIFIYAWSDSNDFTKHDDDKRGQKVVVLQGTRMFEDGIDFDFGDDKTFDVIAPKLEVPAVETSYCYSLHKVPEDADTIYVTGDYAEVEEGSLIHHFIVYACVGELPFSDEDKETLLNESVCDTGMGQCTALVAGWAPGNKGSAYPSNSGFPIGKGVDIEYMMLEVHYDNRDLLEGVEEHGGMHLKYTTEPREVEFGIFSTGEPSPGSRPWEIPADTKDHLQEFECPADCTVAGLDEEVTIVVSNYHMHERGSRMGASIVRDGEEIEFIPYIKNFDFNFQPNIPTRTTLRPGDRVITRCWYDTTGSDEPVPAGIGSTEEMCNLFMFYYPKKPLISCGTVKRPEDPEDEDSELVDDVLCYRWDSLDELTMGLNPADLMGDYEPMVREDSCPASLQDTVGDGSSAGTVLSITSVLVMMVVLLEMLL